MPGATQHGIQGITEAALEPVPTQLAFVFHVTDREVAPRSWTEIRFS